MNPNKLIVILATVLLVLARKQRRRRPNYVDIAYGNPSLKLCECGRANQNYVNGIPQKRIINGTGLMEHEYPWLVAILHKGFISCGGSIISDMYILSAAHCKPKEFEQEDIKLLVGDHDLCSTDNDNTILSVTRIIQHPKYNTKNFQADIMLLRTNMRMTFNKFIRPVCLPQYDYHSKDVPSRYGGKTGIVSGWGATLANASSTTSCTPNQVPLPIFGKGECELPIAPSLFCAGYLNGEGDACKGDSGGPLQYRNTNTGRYEIIGIVSNGVGCADPGIPGFYTDVVQYLPWIWKQIAFDSRTCL